MGNKLNYQKELEKIIEKENGRVPKLLLQVCCAPCSSYVLCYLSNYFEITVLYYNPNISPKEEYELRASEEKRFIGEITPKYPIKFIEGEYEHEKFLSAVKGLENEPEGGKRCEKCFYLRLKKTASMAKEMGFDYFTTTLTISPLKNADLLNRIGFEVAKETGAVWLASDFKKREGYKESIRLSKEHNLYRQNYCGCAFSKPKE